MHGASRALAVVVLTVVPRALAAQQGTVQIFGAAQGITGSEERLAAQNRIEPDVGLDWVQPGSRIGALEVELRGTRRGDRFHAGRLRAAALGVKFGGLTWTFEAGDGHFTRTLSDYRFANLSAPAVTFNGAALGARNGRGAFDLLGGRSTAWRNIWGTDPDTLGQSLFLARGAYTLHPQVEVLGHASRVTTRGLKEFSFTVADSRQAGGGVRYRPAPAVQLIAHGGAVRYRPVHATHDVRDGSLLLGGHLLVGRGWLQMNVSRFSPGEFPVLNDSLHDRDSVFAAGEYDLGLRVRAFGGWEVFQTQTQAPAGADGARTLPRSFASRGFGGVRFQIGQRTLLTVRAEDGTSRARPVFPGAIESETDSGSWSAEYHASLGPFSSYTRWARRENVTQTGVMTTYNQHDVSSQLFVRLSPAAQVFGLGSLTRHDDGITPGHSYWQAGGGAQVQVPRRQLWIRGEATASRNVDLLTRAFVPRESYNVGIHGQLPRGAALSVNVAADRTPPLFGSGTPWSTRSIVRFTQTLSTGSARVPATITMAAAGRTRGTGTIAGTVFTDWNHNGLQEPGEEPIEDIAVRFGTLSTTKTSRDGEFTFVNVPAGPAAVGLDTTAVPVDYDPPAISRLELELERGNTRRVSFGLIPLGTITGRVLHDANGNGRPDQDDTPFEGAVLVLDHGARSEQARSGRYRFDAVRSGDHVVAILSESLPEGATIVGEPSASLVLDRGQLTARIDFLVAIGKRPENRRVFPSRLGRADAPAAPATAGRPRALGPPARAPRAPALAAPPTGAARSGDPARRAKAAAPSPARSGGAAAGTTYAVQIAALRDRSRAAALVQDVGLAGFPAYLVPPDGDGGDGLYRVRVGAYETRAAARAAAARLRKLRHEQAWVVTSGGAEDEADRH